MKLLVQFVNALNQYGNIIRLAGFFTADDGDNHVGEFVNSMRKGAMAMGTCADSGTISARRTMDFARNTLTEEATEPSRCVHFEDGSGKFGSFVGCEWSVLEVLGTYPIVTLAMHIGTSEANDVRLGAAKTIRANVRGHWNVLYGTMTKKGKIPHGRAVRRQVSKIEKMGKTGKMLSKLKRLKFQDFSWQKSFCLHGVSSTNTPV